MTYIKLPEREVVNVDKKDDPVYIPFGSEWELQMMIFKKKELINMLRVALKKVAILECKLGI